MEGLDLIKGTADTNHNDLEVLKDWISDLSEYVGTTKDEIIGKVSGNTKTLDNVCSVIGNVDAQLGVLKGLIVNALKFQNFLHFVVIIIYFKHKNSSNS